MNKAQKELDRRNMVILIFGVVMMVLFLLKPYFYRGYFPSPEDQAWTVGSAPNRAFRYSQCDATEDALFFSSNGTVSCVYAYGHDGTFLYSLEFQDISNGRMHIRCHDGKLYIKLRNDNVFVFQGSIMIAGLTEEQADSQGFTNDWFREGSTLISKGGALYYRDAQENLLPVTVPAQIKIPADLPILDAFASQGGGIVVLLIFAALIGTIMYHTFRKR